MTYEQLLDVVGNWAAILTAGVAVFAYAKYLVERSAKRRRLEQHLKDEKELRFDQGQRTVLHLMSKLRMSEREVLDAAFQSELVECRTGEDDQGRASILFFEYDDGTEPPQMPGRAQF